MQQRNRIGIATLIGLGWITLSFFVEPLFPLGSPSWLWLTAVAWSSAIAIAFWNDTKRLAYRLKNEAKKYIPFIQPAPKERKRYGMEPESVDLERLKIELARLPAEEQDIIYSILYSGGERGFLYDICSQREKTFENLREVGLIIISYSSESPMGRETFYCLRPEAEQIIKDFFESRIGDEGS